MLGCIDQSAAATVEVFLDINRDRRGLSGCEIVPPDVTGLFEHDRLLADGWKLNVEVREMRELLCFLRCKIHSEEVHAVVTVRNEIDFIVRSPHRADVLRG